MGQRGKGVEGNGVYENQGGDEAVGESVQDIMLSSWGNHWGAGGNKSNKEKLWTSCPEKELGGKT